MGAKVLKTIVLALGVLVLAVLALVVVYMIGYGLFAVFTHQGISSVAGGVGAAVVIVAAIVVLGLYLRSRIAGGKEETRERHSRHKRAA